MVEQEFEQIRQFLKQKMPAYLQQHHGISAESSFNCLNPAHHDHGLTMTYDPHSYSVRCYTCGAKFNIFDLAGIDYHLNDFKYQFKKVHELFLGPLPATLQNYLFGRYNSQMGTHQVSQNDDGPLFEIEKDQATNAHEVRSVNFEGGSFEIRPVSSPYRITPVNDDQPTNSNPSLIRSPFQGSGLTFGPSNDQHVTNNTFQNFQSTDFNSEPVSISPFENHREEIIPEYDFNDYYQKCRASLSKTDYLKERGISEEVARKFGLGYDDHFIAGSDQFGAQTIWQALVIPLSSGSYTVRNINPSDQDRYRKNGRLSFFNVKALEKEGSIFITEGEFDALSLETLGCTAVSLGGTGNVRYLIEKISHLDINRSRTFYICLDNDEAGQEAAKALAMGLYQLHIPYKRIDIAFPYKDINEALIHNRQALKERIDHLEELLTFSLTSLPRSAQKQKYITNADEMYSLKLSPVLYTFCLRPQTGRKFIAALIDEQKTGIAYAGSINQWHYISSLIKRVHNEQPHEGNWVKTGLLEVHPDHIVQDIQQGITACKVQGDCRFITIADLTSLPVERCLSVASHLSSICATLNVPIVALCNHEASRFVESQSLQNITITQNDHGDFCCETCDSDGRSINFTLFCNY